MFDRVDARGFQRRSRGGRRLAPGPRADRARGEIICHATLPASEGFGLGLVDEIDDVDEAAASVGADSGMGDREIGLRE